ncbi:hypothetical protein [Marinobacter zhanjiangensis]|uniref:Uncharacterized protein n=1 Tax=Marinobacter zhanjiangensis TaxID=578215 RepID=A0ABQ3B9H6_9GAMM|nr:hypothetical protein [Marinobacter zhanjiangensis]GGY81953.1 hypothetical protein GCM10007071_31630 [Marinobacter zhanjiangensis]
MTGITSPDLKRNNAAGGYVAGSPAAPFPLGPIDYGNDAGLAERRLWAAALASLVDDARAYWRGRGMSGLSADSTTLEAAFDDVCRAGPMTRRCCLMCEIDPQWLSNGFITWCERMDRSQNKA